MAEIANFLQRMFTLFSNIQATCFVEVVQVCPADGASLGDLQTQMEFAAIPWTRTLSTTTICPGLWPVDLIKDLEQTRVRPPLGRGDHPER